MTITVGLAAIGEYEKEFQAGKHLTVKIGLSVFQLRRKPKLNRAPLLFQPHPEASAPDLAYLESTVIDVRRNLYPIITEHSTMSDKVRASRLTVLEPFPLSCTFRSLQQSGSLIPTKPGPIHATGSLGAFIVREEDPLAIPVVVKDVLRLEFQPIENFGQLVRKPFHEDNLDELDASNLCLTTFFATLELE